jgi:hypothetical protein
MPIFKDIGRLKMSLDTLPILTPRQWDLQAQPVFQHRSAHIWG